MTERHPNYPPDEPVIGATLFAPPPGTALADPAGYIGAGQTYDDETGADAEEEWADEDEYDERERYYDDYGEQPPVRQPAFYAIIGLALILGAAFVVMLFTVFRDEGGGGNTAAAAAVKVEIAQPIQGERIQTGKEFNVIASAISNEGVTRFELMINGTTVSEATPAAPDGTVYRGTLKWKFDRKGDYDLQVRVTADSGATADSPKVRVSAVEPIGEKPVEIKGTVIATTNVRTGPGESFQSVAVLNAGQEVRILGRTRGNDWLLIDFESGRWVKRAAIEAAESLDFLPIREATPTPLPLSTSTPLPSPSASPSPSPGANSPDFVPTGALLIDGGSRLRVTVANLSPNNYSGGLEIAVTVTVPDKPKQTVSHAFSANIVANGSGTFDFELPQAVTQPGSAEVRIDPGNAVKEGNETNNNATIQISPPVEQPNLTIQATISGASINVVVLNTGGALAPSSMTVTVSLAGESSSRTQNPIALAKGQSTPPFTLPKPSGPGLAVITVALNNEVVASDTLAIP